MTRALLFLLLAAVTVALVPSRAVRADENAEARILFEEGNRQLAAAMHQHGPRRHDGLEQALQSYVGSVRIVRSRNAVFNCAAVLQELGRLEEAYDYYREYLLMPDVGDSDRAEAQARLAVITPLLAIVEVNSTPSGAEVRVDRRDLAPRGRTPLAFAVPAGDHVLHIDVAGYAHAEAMVSPHTGETTRIVRELAPLPVHVRVLAPAGAHVSIDGTAGDTQDLAPGVHTARGELDGQPPFERRFEVLAGAEPMAVELDATTAGVVEGRGRLVVDANAAGRIVVDGRPIVTGARTATLDLGTGQHALRVEGEGHLPYEGMLDIVDGRTTHAHIALGRDPTTLRHMGAWPWLALITTGIAGAVFVGATVNSFQRHDAYELARTTYLGSRSSQNYGDLSTATSNLNSANSVADGMFVVTLLLAGLTTLFFFLDESAGPPTHGDVEVDGAAPPQPAASIATPGGIAW